jgi:hypothetical protein
MSNRIVIFTNDSDARVISDNPNVSVLFVNEDDTSIRIAPTIVVDNEMTNQMYEEYFKD